MEICDKVLKDFTEGRIGQIYLAYTHFKNTVVHVPTLMKLLPVEFSEEDMSAADKNLIMNYEPNEREALDMIIPKYVTSIFYGALVEAVAESMACILAPFSLATASTSAPKTILVTYFGIIMSRASRSFGS